MISSIHLPLCQLHIVDQLEAIYLVPLSCPIRRAVFQPSSSELLGQSGRRARGRPKQSWPKEMYRHAEHVCNLNHCDIKDIAAIPAEAWKAFVQCYTP